MSLSPIQLADVLPRQGLISVEQAEQIRVEARQMPDRFRSQIANDQKSLGYDLVSSFRFPSAKEPGTTARIRAPAR